MIGYIKTYPPELKMKEYVKYNAYYCGICHSIKDRWGQIPRLTLNYDCVFLAVFLDALLKLPLEYADFRCIVHPIVKKKKVIRSSTVDFIADMNIYLSYVKLADNVKDENNIIHSTTEKVMRGYSRKIRNRYKNLTEKIDMHISEMSRLENENCDNIDEVAECYANIIKDICQYKLNDTDEQNKNIAGKIAYNVGKWVYSADAFDDIEKDIKKNMFNPYLTRFKYEKGQDILLFKEDIRERTSFILYAPLKAATDLYEDIDDELKDPIVKNIIYEGLFDKTEKILNGDK
ncbi:MAG: DUF5685 family protein [Clostridia bacterium]|jgi:hypothetical protein